jgi:hypothetical protein
MVDMTDAPKVDKIDLDRFFGPAVDHYTNAYREKLEAEASKVRNLVEQYYASGLTFDEFARRTKVPKTTLRQRFQKYGIPVLDITGEQIERIKTEARKRNAQAYCDCKHCLPCEILTARGVTF